jgi:hypothetical protein
MQKKFRWRARPLQPVETRSSAGACSRYCVDRAPAAIADDPGLAKTHVTAKRIYVPGSEEDQNDACEDEMNALFEFLTTEPAICPTA